MQTPVEVPSLKIAGEVYVLPSKFLLKELREISGISCIPKPDDPKEAEFWMFDTTVQMIDVALTRMEKKITVDELWQTETSITEMISNRLIILAHSALLPRGKPKSGEELAAA